MMSGKFKWIEFKDIKLEEPFFDSLREDYREFNQWYNKKIAKGEKAFAYIEDEVKAFLYLKKENIDDDDSPIVVDGENLPKKPRVKIGTLKVNDKNKGQRLGEGAIGIALWHWQETGFDEVYLTVYEKHKELIKLLEKFGFVNIGKNEKGELVLVKNRNNLCMENPYRFFPFINGNFDFAKLIPIYDDFHDQLFPYSELIGSNLNVEEVIAGNGITKVFIATPFTEIDYKSGQPVFIYRIYNGAGQKGYKSAITSFCTLTNVYRIKANGLASYSFDNFRKTVGNKTVYSEQELQNIYNKKNVYVLEMIYNGYFGKGNNVIYYKLKQNELFNAYPYELRYSKSDFLKILEMGKRDVQNTVID